MDRMGRWIKGDQVHFRLMRDPDLELAGKGAWILLKVSYSDLAEGQELLVVALGYINHQVLRALWELSRK